MLESSSNERSVVAAELRQQYKSGLLPGPECGSSIQLVEGGQVNDSNLPVEQDVPHAAFILRSRMLPAIRRRSSRA